MPYTFEKLQIFSFTLDFYFEFFSFDCLTSRSQIVIPDDTIKNLYKLKGCKYIQISDYGLYHLGEDVCEFDIPEFKCKQQIRVRTKIHNKKNKNGYCNLSVIIACQPKDIKQLTKSSYSLDNSKSLPKNLIYKE